MRFTRFLAAVLLATVAASAAAQTIVRIRDAAGQVIAELTVAAGSSVEVLNGPPGPRPLPPGPVPPIPPAPPLPPAPAPATAVKHVIVIRSDQPGAMSPGQLALLADPALQAQLRQRGLSWHVFEVNSAEVQRRPPAGLGYAKWLGDPALAAGPNLQAPCLLLIDNAGKLARGLPLPADAAGLLAALGEP